MKANCSSPLTDGRVCQTLPRVGGHLSHTPGAVAAPGGLVPTADGHNHHWAPLV